MSSKFIVLLVAVAGFGLGAGALTEPAFAPLADAADPTYGATYMGSESCKKCHFQMHRTWLGHRHSEAWNDLPESYRDPSHVDDEGRSCVSCHVTGWGDWKRGGFVDADQSAHLLGVQCEACHGPGSRHVALGQRMIQAKKKRFDPGEATFTIKTPTSCSTCHNPHIDHAEFIDG
jgi:hypothetical protein